MAGADASSVALSFLKETTFGVTPSGSLQRARFTSEGLNVNTETTQSDEINSTRDISDVVRIGRVAEGDIGIEMSYGTHDAFMEAALLSSDWSATVVVIAANNTISVTGGNTFHKAAASWTNTPAVPSWVKVSGFTSTMAVNNGIWRVTSADTDDVTVDGTLTNGAAGDSVTITQLSYIQNGTNLRSYSIEKQFTDLTNKFEVFLGMCFDGLSLEIPTKGKISGSVSLLGKSGASASATIGTGYTAQTTTRVMNSIDHVVKLLENSSSANFIGLTMQIANSLRDRAQVATLGPESIGKGDFVVTGTLKQYYASETIMDKYLNGTVSSLSLQLQDANGNGYIFWFPSVVYTAGKRNATGKNTDVIADLGWQAYKSATFGFTMQVIRY